MTPARYRLLLEDWAATGGTDAEFGAMFVNTAWHDPIVTDTGLELWGIDSDGNVVAFDPNSIPGLRFHTRVNLTHPQA